WLEPVPRRKVLEDCRFLRREVSWKIGVDGSRRQQRGLASFFDHRLGRLPLAEVVVHLADQRATLEMHLLVRQIGPDHCREGRMVVDELMELVGHAKEAGARRILAERSQPKS